MPIGFCEWFFGESVVGRGNPENQADIAQTQDRRYLLTLWLLSSQPGIAESSDAPLNRQVVRRSQRANVQPRVRITYLRPTPAPIGRTSDPTFRHRWIVSGHWRQQAWGPKQSLRKPIWIAPHLKGPDGAPVLRNDNKVKAWVR
jgi:hypothetical protein